MKHKVGFYWISFPDEPFPTVGELRNEFGRYPWMVVGSDEIFSGNEFEVICAIQEPPCAAQPHE